MRFRSRKFLLSTAAFVSLMAARRPVLATGVVLAYMAGETHLDNRRVLAVMTANMQEVEELPSAIGFVYDPDDDEEDEEPNPTDVVMGQWFHARQKHAMGFAAPNQGVKA